MTYHAVDRYNEDRYVQRTLLSPETVKIVTMAKLLTSELVSRVTDECLQFHGGFGYMEESFIARVWRDQRLIRIGAGASEVMRYSIAKMMGF
jgi:citronellyl-CoA dehydrogenase